MLPTETPDLARAVALIELKRYAEAAKAAQAANANPPPTPEDQP